MVAVLAIGFMAYGVVQIVVAFEVKKLPSQGDKWAKQFDDVPGTSRSDAARTVPSARTALSPAHQLDR